MTINDKIRSEKLLILIDIKEKLQKYPHYHQIKLIIVNILQVKKYYLPVKVKL